MSPSQSDHTGCHEGKALLEQYRWNLTSLLNQSEWGGGGGAFPFELCHCYGFNTHT